MKNKVFIIIFILLISILLLGMSGCDAISFSQYFTKSEKANQDDTLPITEVKEDLDETEDDDEEEEEFVIDPNLVTDEIILLDYNIRTATPDDGGNRNWSVRKNIIFKQIETYSPDIIGMQEVKSEQAVDIKERFSEEYNYVGRGRDLSLGAESNPIMYKKNRFMLLESDTFWLSETPEYISKGWNASHYRICTYVKLKDMYTGKEFSYYNTHLDHISKTAQYNGANVIIEKMLADENPCLLTGDMNTYMTSDVYKNYTAHFDDTRYIAVSASELCATYNGYSVLTGGSPIDFCFAKKDCFEVLSFEVKNLLFDKEGNPLPEETKESEDVLFASDHFPLLVQFKIK